jgi:hypothetical protein
MLETEKKPNFIVVGATKAATTWLYYCLDEHPEVFVPEMKEVNYFSWHYSKKATWYNSFFKNIKDKKAIGEISPSYMIASEVPERIYQWNSDIRLFFILREPVQRAYSHYCMKLRYGLASDNIEQELLPGKEFITEGLYFKHISRFLKVFPSEQIKVLIYEDLKHNPELFLKEVFSFLEVDTSFKPTIANQVQYSRRPRQRFPKLYSFLVNIYQWLTVTNSHSRKIIEYLRRKGLIEALHQLNSDCDFPVYSAEKQKFIAEFYKQDTTLLSEWLGRDLSFWLKPYLN